MKTLAVIVAVLAGLWYFRRDKLFAPGPAPDNALNLDRDGYMSTYGRMLPSASIGSTPFQGVSLNPFSGELTGRVGGSSLNVKIPGSDTFSRLFTGIVQPAARGAGRDGDGQINLYEWASFSSRG